MSILHLGVTFIASLFKSQRQMALENMALRQQVTMLRRSVKRPRAAPADKLFWIFFSRYFDGWRELLLGLHPDTVVRWHRHGFRLYWNWKSRGPGTGRSAINTALRKLIREMQASNIGWGAPATAPVTARPASKANFSNCELKYLRQQSLNTCCSQRSRHHKPGKLSTIMQTVWLRWIYLRFQRPVLELSMCSLCSAMTAAKAPGTPYRCMLQFRNERI